MNTMYSTQAAATPNYAAMNIQDLIKMSEKNNSIILEAMKQTEEINATIQAKRQEAFESILSQMKVFGITFDELSTRLPGTTPSSLEQPISGNPSIKDVFDEPAFKETYKPKAAMKKAVAAVPEVKTLESPMAEEDTNTNEALPFMDDLLADDPRYAPKRISIKKRKKLPLMDDLLSGEPINALLMMGYTTDPETEKYKQDKRIFSPAGIAPTLTTHGNALINI